MIGNESWHRAANNLLDFHAEIVGDLAKNLAVEASHRAHETCRMVAVVVLRDASAEERFKLGAD